MRAKLIISEAKIEEFASLGLTDREISDLAEIKPADFKDAISRGRARLHKTLRTAQIKSALKGNASMLIFLGKVYLNQRETIAHDVSTSERTLSITPNVLERLQTSYRLTMEQVRARGALPAHAGEGAPGVPGDPHRSLKTDDVSQNSEILNGEKVEQ